ncbi:MAG: hypothetical protein AVO33_07440 [delta proteobacterium ML8_F1]|nr:MAG: hypothetical protein AVO33_07440 [delta proteobacterium ML8_F1]
MKNTRVLLFGMMALMAFGSISFAEDTEGTEAYTLEALIEMAREKSQQDILNDFKIEFAQDDLDEAIEVAEFNAYSGGGRLETLFRMTKVHVDTFRAESALKLAQLQKEADEYLIVTEVHELVYDVKTMEMGVEAARTRLAQAKLSYEADEKRYELGIISLLDLNNSQNDYQTAQIDLMEAESDLRDATNQLKIKVGIDPSQPLELNVTVEQLPFNRTYSGDLAEGAIDKDRDLYSKYTDYFADKTLFELTDDAYEPFDKEYKIAYYDSEISRLAYEDAFSSFSTGLRGDFFNLDVLETRIKIQDLYLEIARKNDEIAGQKLALGMISEVERLGEEADYLEARQNRMQSIINYNMKVLELEEILID